MIIKVNGESFEIKEGSSLKDFSEIRNLPEQGVAVAVNDNMVTRAEWSNTVLKEGDNVIVIRAVCGG